MDVSMLLQILDGHQISMLWTAILCILAYSASSMIYNLYLHPLAGIPGPWWAAISHLHEFYFDVILHGRFFKQIENMHARYGPIVRINPREIHISDPSFYDSIYTSSSQLRNKDPQHVTFGSAPLAMVSTVSHSQHRIRRAILSNYFSKSSVTRVEALIQTKIARLIEHLKEVAEERKIVDLHLAMMAFASDVISEYAYGQSYDNLEHRDFNGLVNSSVTGLMRAMHIARFFPFFFPVIKVLPLWMAKRLSPGLGQILEYRMYMSKFAVEALGRNEGQEDKGKEKTKGTLFDALASPTVPEDERTPARIEDEAWVVSLAASETVARTLTVLLFFVLQDEHILQTLREELKTVPEKPSWKQLEGLKYLTATINEALRLSIGPTMRLPRINPFSSIVYNNHVIPPGHPVSSSVLLLNLDPALYPSPLSFRPERWLSSSTHGSKLPLFTFSRGARACLGINLAYAELYLLTYALTTTLCTYPFSIELVNPRLEDMMPYRDLVMGASKSGYFGLKARVLRVGGDEGEDE